MSTRHTLGVAALALLAGGALAQTPNPSFALVGHIERFGLDDASQPLGGGTLRLRGIDVTLPRNLLVTMPGQYLTLQDLFRGPAGGAVQASSGLALEDPTPPRLPFEAELQGNIVGGQYIAGVARISQGALHVGSGVIQAIDGARGELRVGAPGGATGARVRLNDPKGIYGQANGDGAKAALPLDQRFSLDPDNSPVHARTGFPVCIARGAGDALCPAANRPADPAARRYTCGTVSAEPLAPALPGCDPSRPAPLRVGDHVAHVGMLVPDPAGGFVIVAHGLEAEVGVYTSPGAEPVYVFIEEALMGTLGQPFADVPQEETSRVRIVGFTTDPSRPVDISLIDSGRNETGTPLTGPGGRCRPTRRSSAAFATPGRPRTTHARCGATSARRSSAARTRSWRRDSRRGCTWPRSASTSGPRRRALACAAFSRRCRSRTSASCSRAAAASPRRRARRRWPP